MAEQGTRPFIIKVPALAVLGLVLLVSCSVVTSSSITPTPALIDDRNLTAIALEAAVKLGLQGNPTAQRTVRMTLGEWASLNNEGFPGDQSKSVFVFAAIGQIEWKGPGEPRPNPRRYYEGIVIVLDAQTGGLIQASASPTLSAMPFQIPLNSQTPVSPVDVKSKPTLIAPSPVPTAIAPNKATSSPVTFVTPTLSVPAYP